MIALSHRLDRTIVIPALGVRSQLRLGKLTSEGSDLLHVLQHFRHYDLVQ